MIFWLQFVLSPFSKNPFQEKSNGGARQRGVPLQGLAATSKTKKAHGRKTVRPKITLLLCMKSHGKKKPTISQHFTDDTGSIGSPKIAPTVAQRLFSL